MIRLYRLLPLVIIFAILSLIVYAILTFRYSSNRAKSLMIKIFFWIFAVLSIVCAILTAYALLDQNMAVAELVGSCLALMLIGLIIVLICRAIFRKHNPHLDEEVTQATFVNESIVSKFGKAFSQALSQALKDTFTKHKK